MPPGATARSSARPAVASRCRRRGPARAARGSPLILWTSLWAHPRSAAHLLSYLALRRLYRSADAVVTYGPHVSAYVRARGARNVHVAPQSVDNAFWSAAESGPRRAARRGRRDAAVKFLFAGRPTREKGLGVLIEAWSDSGLAAPSAALVLVGVGSAPPWVPAGGAVRRELGLDHGARLLDPIESCATCTRARRRAGRAVDSHPHLPRAVGVGGQRGHEPAAARDRQRRSRRCRRAAWCATGATAWSCPRATPRALAGAMRRLAADAPLRARLGAAGAADVQAYTHDAWAAGFASALREPRSFPGGALVACVACPRPGSPYRGWRRRCSAALAARAELRHAARARAARTRSSKPAAKARSPTATASRPTTRRSSRCRPNSPSTADCPDLIHKAQLAAAAGSGAGPAVTGGGRVARGDRDRAADAGRTAHAGKRHPLRRARR